MFALLYPWIKALHVAAVLVFAGGVMSMTAFLHACGHRPADIGTMAATMRRWDRRMTTPAMLLVWALGLGLAQSGAWFGNGWLQAKLVLVVVLSGIHGVQSGQLRRLSQGGPAAPTRFTWLPFACVLAIVTLAVVKPS